MATQNENKNMVPTQQNKMTGIYSVPVQAINYLLITVYIFLCPTTTIRPIWIFLIHK